MAIIPDVDAPSRSQLPTVDPQAFQFGGLDFSLLGDFLRDAAPVNEEQLIRNVGTSTDLGIAASAELSEAAGSQFLDLLGTVNPEAANLQQLLNANLESFARGEIPSDVAREIANRRAELSAVTGAGALSPRTSNLTARDLGLTSLDLKERGNAGIQQALIADRNLALNLSADPTEVSLGILSELNDATTPAMSDVLNTGLRAALAQQEGSSTAALADLQTELSFLELALGADVANARIRGNLLGDLLGAGATIFASGALDGLFGERAGGGSTNYDPFNTSTRSSPGSSPYDPYLDTTSPYYQTGVPISTDPRLNTDGASGEFLGTIDGGPVYASTYGQHNEYIPPLTNTSSGNVLGGSGSGFDRYMDPLNPYGYYANNEGRA